MELHYDPAYQRGRRKDGREATAVIALETLDGASFAEAAKRIIQLVEQMN